MNKKQWQRLGTEHIQVGFYQNIKIRSHVWKTATLTHHFTNKDRGGLSLSS
jgi:hypothetical protein